jgi:hypothetical protein
MNPTLKWWYFHPSGIQICGIVYGSSKFTDGLRRMAKNDPS